MILSRRAVLATLVAAMPCAARAGGAARATAPSAAPSWAQGLRSRARLIAGPSQGSARLAGIEIVLDAGFKTYWRTAGDSGLPPAFDWGASENLDHAEVLWPVPTRFEEAGGTSYGYSGSVVLPVKVAPRRADRPVRLAVTMEYGVCKEICIPARGEMTLDLPSSGENADAIEAALARVPVRQALGAPGALSVLRVDPVGPHLTATVRAPAEPEPQLFVEGPEAWYLGAAEPRPQSQSPAGSRIFAFDILERPKQETGPVDLRLTLSAGGQAIETEVRLDPGAPSR